MPISARGETITVDPPVDQGSIEAGLAARHLEPRSRLPFSKQWGQSTKSFGPYDLTDPYDVANVFKMPGAALFVRVYPRIKPALEAGDRGKTTLPSVTGTSPWPWIAGIAAAVAMSALPGRLFRNWRRRALDQASPSQSHAASGRLTPQPSHFTRS